MKFRLLEYLAFAILLVAVGACKPPDHFTVTGEIAGNPNMNIYVRYYGDDAVRQGVTAANDGKFSFKARSSHGALVELMDNEYRVLGRLFLANGDKANVKIDRRNPNLMEVEGHELSQQWAAVMQEQADSLLSGTPESINAIVEEYIAANPDSPIASLMFASFYNIKAATAVRADSVMQSIGAEGRIATVLDPFVTALQRISDPDSYARLDTLVYRGLNSDSAIVFRAKDKELSLIVFESEQSRHADSIAPRLKELLADKKLAKRLQVLDLNLSSDSNAWKRTTRRDTADWIQAWIPGGIFAKGVDHLALPSLPYAIVVDSAGTQLYRGNSLRKAIEKVKR